MTKFFLIAASAVSAIASSPVVAREPAANTAPVEQNATAHTDSSAQRYCVVETVTGSRIAHKKCLTRGDWLKEGFDPLSPDK